MKKLHLIMVLIAFTTLSCSSDDPSSEEMEVIIKPNVGLGTITFNDNGNKVLDVYGAYERLTSVGSLSKTYFVMWYENGLGFQLDYVNTEGLSLQEVVDMSDELIDLDQEILQIIIMSPFEAMTTEGVSLGSSRAEVYAAFGEPDDVSSLIETYDDINMNFWYNSSDFVTRIDLFR